MTPVFGATTTSITSRGTGWNDDAPEPRKHAYRLKNIDGLDAFVGSLVHRRISQVLTNIRDGKPERLRPEILGHGLEHAFVVSARGYWFKAPKRTRFFEDHYGDVISPERK